MKNLHKNTGSFRDPSGYVLSDEDGRIYRAITPKGLANFLAVEQSGLFKSLIARGQLVSYEKLKASDFNLPVQNTALLLSHPCIPYISYPYEWTFEQLKAAALLHLDVHLQAMEKNITLSDATAYNVQFVGSEPIFIDHLSFLPYREGMLWKGQQQFVDQFVIPLLMWDILKIPHNDWYRGSFAGIPAKEVNRLVPLRRRLSFNYQTFIALPCRFERKNTAKPLETSIAVKERLPKEGFLFILRQLKRWISGFKNPHQKTLWDNYGEFRNYDDIEVNEKHRFIRKHVGAAKPQLLIDVGSNTGEFSFSALEAGASCVVGLEMDHGAVSRSYAAGQKREAAFLPLCINLLNPSPSMGWNETERNALSGRGKADFVLSLAVVHHLAIGGNIPLESFIQYITKLGRDGIIEWIPKTDSMIKTMLLNREDIFADYTEEKFRQYLEKYALIRDSEVISKTGRTLYYYTGQ